MSAAHASEPRYFHGSDRSHLEAGTLLVPGGPVKQHLRVEEIFEAVRQELFPDRPSRFGCVFVSDDPKRSAIYGTLYRVSIEGNVFRADGELFTDGVLAPSEHARVHSAIEYWEGPSDATNILEILVEGTVRVLGPGPARIYVPDRFLGYWTVSDDWRDASDPREVRTIGGA